MPEQATSSLSSSSTGGTAADRWPVEAADFVVRTVGTVRDKTTGPVIFGARALVFGLFAACMGVIAALLSAIALVRVLTVYVPGNRVWVSDLIIGGVFTLAGLGLWTQTRARD
jgi:hypothetical protein